MEATKNTTTKTATTRAIDFTCPKCGARAGRACKGSRIPSANGFGGGWGGPSELEKPHAERYAARRDAIAAHAADAARRAAFDATAAATADRDTAELVALVRAERAAEQARAEATHDAHGPDCDGWHGDTSATRTKGDASR